MDNIEFSTWIALGGALIVALIIGKYLTAWYHEIDKRNRYMEVQIKLLAQIAKANGVTEDKILEIGKEAKLPPKNT